MKPLYTDDVIFREIVHDASSKLVGRKTKHHNQIRDAINGMLLSKKYIRRSLLNGNYNQLMKLLDYPITDDKINLAIDDIHEYTKSLIQKFESEMEKTCELVHLFNDSKTPKYIGKNEFVKRVAGIYRYVNHNETFVLVKMGKLGEFYYMVQDYCKLILTSRTVILSPYVYKKAYDIVTHDISEDDSYDVPMNYIQILNMTIPVIKHGV